MITSYFWNGFQHLAFAIFCVLLFYCSSKKLPHNKITFWIGIIFTSSSLFFLPSHIGKYGSFIDWAYQFLHYPLPDWDILLFNMNWHRFFISHSALLPILLFAWLWNKNFGISLRPLIIGVSIGLGSHLIWDAITGSLLTPIVFIPYLFSITGYLAKCWLIFNGLLLFLAAYHLQNNQKTYK